MTQDCIQGGWFLTQFPGAGFCLGKQRTECSFEEEQAWMNRLTSSPVMSILQALWHKIFSSSFLRKDKVVSRTQTLSAQALPQIPFDGSTPPLTF